MSTVPEPYPKNSASTACASHALAKAGIALAQIAKDFDIHEMTLTIRMKRLGFGGDSRYVGPACGCGSIWTA